VIRGKILLFEVMRKRGISIRISSSEMEERGLVNGAMGIVRDIVWLAGIDKRRIFPVRRDFEFRRNVQCTIKSQGLG
jgi:hypothetical protein